MDMNWIDEIRDPEPRKRYIYNADDYDPQYGDPYYREHSTRADSLWRLYEESGTSITFDAFADESRQTDYRMETGALRDFFNGSQSALSSYRNPMGGNPLIAFGVIGRWDGKRTGVWLFPGDVQGHCGVDYVAKRIKTVTGYPSHSLRRRVADVIGSDAFADEMRRFLPAGLMTSTVESPRWSAWAIEQIGTLYGTPGTPSSADAVPGFPIFGASNDSSPTR